MAFDQATCIAISQVIPIILLAGHLDPSVLADIRSHGSAVCWAWMVMTMIALVGVAATLIGSYNGGSGTVGGAIIIFGLLCAMAGFISAVAVKLSPRSDD